MIGDVGMRCLGVDDRYICNVPMSYYLGHFEIFIPFNQTKISTGLFYHYIKEPDNNQVTQNTKITLGLTCLVLIYLVYSVCSKCLYFSRDRLKNRYVIQ